MLSINDTTPYSAVYGRVPKLLLNIEQIHAENKRELPSLCLMRHVHRLREISVQQMVEGTARARLGRTANTRSLLAAQLADYKVGEEVDFYRPPGSKDEWLDRTSHGC